MATLAQWVHGARPRTLPAAVAPVLAGTGSASALHGAAPGRAVLALLVSLCLQVGVNYANDYSDGIRGTDARRVGPVRLVGQALAEPVQVKVAAFGAFAAAAALGLALVAVSGTWWLLLVGAASIAAAWYYTGGRHPYGYAGLGELFVFVFFGLVATLGTTYTQAGRVDLATVAAAVGVGALACALLVANNLRDIPDDRRHGKLTLAVRLGDRRTRTLYALLVAAALLAVAVAGSVHRTALVAVLAFALAVPLLRLVRGGATGRELVPALLGTGRLELVYAALLALGLGASRHLG